MAALPVGGAAPDASNVQQAVPFFWVRNLDTSIRFYVDGLGFRMTKQWIVEGQLRWCWLELGDVAVMLQQFWRGGPHDNMPTSQTGLGVSINFICRDALTIYRDMVARGLPAARPFVGNGMWVTHVSDPDGYAIYFESPTNVPEDTVYAEHP